MNPAERLQFSDDSAAVILCPYARRAPAIGRIAERCLPVGGLLSAFKPGTEVSQRGPSRSDVAAFPRDGGLAVGFAEAAQQIE